MSRLSACACLVTLLLFGGLVSSISAFHLHWMSMMVNRATSRTLDSNQEGKVYAIPMNGGNYQKWFLQAAGDNIFTFTNIKTGRVLDSNPEGKVYTIPSNGGNSQKWRMRGDFLENVGTGRYLDAGSNGDVYTLPHNGGTYQRWAILKEVQY